MDAIEYVGGEDALRKLIACVKEHPEIWMSSKEELSKGVLIESFEQVFNSLGLQGQVSVSTVRCAWLELLERSEPAAISKDPLLNDLTWLQWVHRTKRMGCAVAWCATKEGDKDCALFNAPPRGSDLWQEWCNVVPSLQRVTDLPLKVCALHFRNGVFDNECLVPVLRLSNPRKRKAAPLDSTKTGSLDRELQAVTDSVFEREVHLFGETDAQQPLKLPSCSTASPRVMKMSMPDGSAESKKSPGVSGKSAKVFKLAQSTDNGKEHAEKPVKDTTPQQPVTLMSVLEQCLNSKEPETVVDKMEVMEKSSMSNGACDKCVNDLPSLRRSLGRLEGRVDSMIAIVRTLCARQSRMDQHKANNAQMVQTPSVRLIKANATTNPVSTNKQLNTPGGRATVIRVKSGNGSTFKLLRTSPRAVQPTARAKECSPPSLSTKFTRAPKQPDTSLTYLHRAVIRSLLLFQGPQFCIASFRAKGPAVVSLVAEDKLRVCLSRLVSDGLLSQTDKSMELTNPKACFRKEYKQSCISKLFEYGISKRHYHASLETH